MQKRRRMAFFATSFSPFSVSNFQRELNNLKMDVFEDQKIELRHSIFRLQRNFSDQKEINEIAKRTESLIHLIGTSFMVNRCKLFFLSKWEEKLDAVKREHHQLPSRKIIKCSDGKYRSFPKPLSYSQDLEKGSWIVSKFYQIHVKHEPRLLSLLNILVGKYPDRMDLKYFALQVHAFVIQRAFHSIRLNQQLECKIKEVKDHIHSLTYEIYQWKELNRFLLTFLLTAFCIDHDKKRSAEEERALEKAARLE
jgi:hypothetical protein